MAINPHLVRRGSPLFRETVFVNFEQALAQHGLRAIGEEAFRGKFDLNRGGEGPRGRWLDSNFLAVAKRLFANGSGACILLLVTLGVYLRIRHDRPQFLNVQPDVRIYDTSSGERIGDDADNAEGPLRPLEGVSGHHVSRFGGRHIPPTQRIGSAETHDLPRRATGAERPSRSCG